MTISTLLTATRRSSCGLTSTILFLYSSTPSIFLIVSDSACSYGFAGIGSNLHSLTYSLGVAIDVGRVMLLNNAGAGYGDNWCPPDKRNFECFVIPMTHCPPETWTDVTTNDNPQPSWILPSKYVLPHVFERWLTQKELNVPGYYWWRAQAATYIFRLNAQARQEILKRRKVVNVWLLHHLIIFSFRGGHGGFRRPGTVELL